MAFEEKSVLFRPNGEFTTQRITTVNRQNVYRVNLDDCPRYISLNPDIEYIGLIRHSKFHVFKLTDGEIPEDFQANFSHFDEGKINILSGKVTKEGSWEIKKGILNSFKLIPNFLFIHSYEFLLSCVRFRNLDMAKQIITVLNADLHRMCPNFTLNIDYVFSLPDPSIVTAYTLPAYASTLLLCLFNDNNCVSSLEIEIDRRDLTISSRTNTPYENRKFNKLLRATIIIIAKAIEPKMQNVLSEAITDISAYLMIHSFNAVYENDEIKIDKNSTFAEVSAVMDERKSITSGVELNDENIRNAVAVFNETISRVNCGPLIATAAAAADDANANAKGTRSRRHSKKHNKHNKSFIKKRFKDDSLY
jgi:hypothetical protein